MSDCLEKMDIVLCINEANAFFAIGEYCNEIDRTAQSQAFIPVYDAFYSFPAIVNLSFACELYLKAIIYWHNKIVEQGHNLQRLYHALSPDIQENINKHFMTYTKHTTIEETISIHELAFTCWRYGYEYDNRNIEAYPENLLSLARALKDAYADNAKQGEG